MTQRRPPRVLHVLGSLGVGGVETWLVRVARGIDPSRVALDFLLHSSDRGVHAPEIEALGSRIFVVPYTRSPRRYAMALRRVLREGGPYAAIHSHVHHFTGLVLALAARNGVPRRIAHSHSDTSLADARGRLPRRAYLAMSRWLIHRYMTVGLAASGVAAAALFGPRWREDARVRVLPCGVDLGAFEAPADRVGARRELGIPDHATVFGHVGRFDEPKNHRFLVEIASALVSIAPDAWFLWVGDGPLRDEISRSVAAAGLAGRVVMPGARQDVARMLSAMDGFLFPSLWEGMPVSLIEAQAAGLPCLVSREVTAEAVVIPSAVTRRGLEEGAVVWARAAAATILARNDRQRRGDAALAAIRASPLDVEANARALEVLYAA